MLPRLLAIIQKEFIQTLRDRSTLVIMISIPLLQLILFGYAALSLPYMYRAVDTGL